MNDKNVTMHQLLKVGAHFGNQSRFRNPKMNQFIYGTRHKIDIIDLGKTLPLYKDAVKFLAALAGKKGKVLFVGTKNQAKDTIKEAAIKCNMPYVNHRWLGGMLTNYKTIRLSIKRYRDLEAKKNSEDFAKLTKKEALNVMRELTKMENNLGGIKNMNGLPDALFVIDIAKEKTAVTEAQKLKIPVIAIVDTNNDPDDITHVVPGNDDSAGAIKLYLDGIVDAILFSQKDIVEEIKPSPEKEVNVVKKPSRQPKKKIVSKKE